MRSELSRPAIVLDASAAVEVALWTDQGSRLATLVAEAEEVVVPDHFHLEGTAAIRRLEVRNEISSEDAGEALEHFLALGVRRVDTAPMLRDAWTMRHNVTMADALYVVLARRLQTALVTGDVRLSKAPRLGIEVLGADSSPATPAAGQQVRPSSRPWADRGMVNLVGGVTVVVEADRDVTYSEVEDALQAEGFLSGYMINRSATSSRTELTISVHVPMSAITADGVPTFEAARVLSSVANTLSRIDASRAGLEE